MKHSLKSAVTIISLVLALSLASSAQAPLKANVPFDFKVGDRVLPAGEYSVSRIFSGSPLLLAVRDGSGRQVAAVNGIAVDAQEAAGHARLVFVLTDEGYALHRILFGDGEDGVSAPAVNSNRRGTVLVQAMEKPQTKGHTSRKSRVVAD